MILESEIGYLTYGLPHSIRQQIILIKRNKSMRATDEVIFNESPQMGNNLALCENSPFLNNGCHKY